MVVVVARRWGIGSMTPPLEQRPPADAPGEPADGALLSAGEAEIAGGALRALSRRDLRVPHPDAP